MTKNFEIGINRLIEFYDDGAVVIKDTTTMAQANFTEKRWLRFVKKLKKVDLHVMKLDGNASFDFCKPLGDHWHVSVNTPHKCVNVRKYYYN